MKIHVWDEKEKRFFVWGDLKDKIWKRRIRQHKKFMKKISENINWTQPNKNHQHPTAPKSEKQ